MEFTVILKVPNKATRIGTIPLDLSQKYVDAIDGKPSATTLQKTNNTTTTEGCGKTTTYLYNYSYLQKALAMLNN